MLLEYLSPHRSVAIAAIMLGFLASLAEGIGIGLFIPFFQSLELESANANGDSWLGDSLGNLFDQVPTEQRVTAIAFGIFGAVLLKAVLTFGNTVIFARLGARIAHELRTRIFDQVLTADFRTLNKAGTGRILNALSEESWRTAEAITVMLQSVIAIFTFFVYLTLLLLISWKLTLVVASLLILIAAAVRLVTHGIGSAGTELTRTNAKVASKMVDGVSGVEVIRGYGQEAHERQRFAGLSRRLADLSVRVGTISGGVYPIYEVLAAAILVGVLLTSVQSATSLAPLLVFVLLLYRLAPMVKRIEQTRVDLNALEGAVRETCSITHQAAESSVRSGEAPFAGMRDGVTLEHVSYCYEPDAPDALRDISLAIPATGLTAIVGPSGAGKSTLIKLLLRFFDPTEGSILVDGKSLTSLKLDDWRARLAVVPQKVFMFNATVRQNIAYGALEADDEAIIAAATAAGAHDFILGLPQGYDTRLGESGVQLSGGEGQRICLARAMIRKPGMLLLDEATNALDGISEDLIQQALERLRERCAVVVIAHRLATIERADQVLVLDNGRLVEQGNLQQLVHQGGLFAQLHELQRFEREHGVRAGVFCRADP